VEHEIRMEGGPDQLQHKEYVLRVRDRAGILGGEAYVFNANLLEFD